ncbi:MAG: bifunctional diaminohydroxyphosphoribosylaminopyrimidine deaminase/5-amino-6-(5-phosphoribosylamino)uracil reductase RibD [Lentisphaerales bacterium]|nr:bifunctional diaminohydroxyphosphoribosylaminopyrimidine deaminase/5-amino-6-(5-phosphoribosylamino)uracil reductase RibD [Lentisphaerales bacterium]
MTDDEKWMNLACDEALKAFGQTSPNPLVGAVAVKDNKLISTGYHHKAGLAHAEVDCLKENIDYTGATIYVTLEPCSTHGRTPPCTQKIIDNKIKRVVIGTLDPNPDHAGRAVKILQDQNIDVTTNIISERCWSLNPGFFKWISQGKPYVILKMAMTLDGKIATKTGQSKWITGPEAREEVQRLRQWCDAIMVGGETVKLDDSGLKVALENWKQPKRYIWSSRKDLPENAKVFDKDGAAAEYKKPIDKDSWNSFLTELADREYTSLLLEGGGELAANALSSDIVDEICFFIAPKILTGRDSRPVVGGLSPDSLDDSINVRKWAHKSFGNDLCITGYLNDLYQLPKHLL